MYLRKPARHLISLGSAGGSASYLIELMDIETKLEILDQIYEIYDRFCARLSVACERNCAICCTGNVTLTTLEGYRMIEDMLQKDKADLPGRLDGAAETGRFQPKITTNQLADLCRQGKKVPEEDNGQAATPCFFLEKDECPLYTHRPFGCRCLMSRRKCDDTGYADMDDFVLSVNTVFLQTIEHIDSDGFSGNLIDVLLFLRSKTHRQDYRSGRPDVTGTRLIPNRPMTILFVPPEHQNRMAPILQAVQAIQVPVKPS